MMPADGWTPASRQLYRQARHQRISELAKQHLSSDSEDNWTDSDRPQDIRRYWAALTDTERAFERLQNTDAALYMAFYEQMMRNIPE
jgi:hypothetical protein